MSQMSYQNTACSPDYTHLGMVMNRIVPRSIGSLKRFSVSQRLLLPSWSALSTRAGCGEALITTALWCKCVHSPIQLRLNRTLSPVSRPHGYTCFTASFHLHGKNWGFFFFFGFRKDCTAQEKSSQEDKSLIWALGQEHYRGGQIIHLLATPPGNVLLSAINWAINWQIMSFNPKARAKYVH